MQTVETIPGRTYAVESVGEVIVTNTETGAIATQGDGFRQVWFTACSNSYTVSDDAAKVVALFKLAPRLRLALLQGGAGGWLPKGFTELEYLEASGLQYILLPNPFTTTADFSFSVEAQQTKATPGYWQHFFGARSGNYDTGGALSDTVTCVVDWRASMSMTVAEFERFSVFCDVSKVIVNGAVSEWNNSGNVGREVPYMRVFDKFGSRRFIGRIFNVNVRNAGAELCDLVPVLRNSDGIPGFWDKVSKTFFANQGTGSFGYRIKRTGETVAPMSLRDPWRVAPSGVYARTVGENELEILADTEETSGEGWEWFANTAEAYEHFGIVPQEELLTE